MDDLLDLQPGAELRGTQYRVIRRVGQGGMGAVFEIEHVRLKKRLVAKTLHPGLRTRDDFLARMEIEAQTLARIAHPNIVEVHDLGVTADGIPFFVMEKLEGSDLRRVLRTRRYLDLEDALTIIEDILEALAHAHREGVVHRDIKPENIFLARSGTETITKVLDFGIVKVMDDPRNLTGQRFLGTPQYASPEQLRGDPATEKTDLYSVGCVLFELITGQRPFKGPTARDCMMQHLSHAPPALSSEAPNPIPRALDEIVAMALEKDPKKRPSNALWFASQLHQIRQQSQQVVLAEANTTEEMLINAISTSASSEKLAVAPTGTARPKTGDTEKDPNLAQGLELTEPSTNPQRTAPMHSPSTPGGQAPPQHSLRDRPTRTGAPVSLPPPTESLTPSQVAAVHPSAAHRLHESGAAISQGQFDGRVVSDGGVSLSSTVLPRRTWRGWALIASPVVVALVVAAVIIVRGSKPEPTTPSTASATPSTTAMPVQTTAATSVAQPSIAPATASTQPASVTTSPPASPAKHATRGAPQAPAATSAPATPSAPPSASAKKDPPPPPRDDLMRSFQ